MSDLPQQLARVQYQANGTTTVFNFPFVILIPDDIAVYVTPAGQTANPQADIVPDSNYSVSILPFPTGGTITFNTAPAIGSIVTLVRQMDVSINTEFSQAQNFNGQNLDDAFERIVLIMQELYTLYNTNALSYVINSYFPSVGTNFLPTLSGTNQIWTTLNGNIVAAQIVEGEDVSTLRSQLASEVEGADGASLIGFYDVLNSSPTRVNTYLNNSAVNFRTLSLKNISAIDSGTPNDVIVTTDSHYTNQFGNRIFLVCNAANTGASTITINSLTTFDILKYNSAGQFVTLNLGDMVAGGLYELVCTTNNSYLLVNPVPARFYGASFYASTNQVYTTGQTINVAFNNNEYDTGALIFSSNSFKIQIAGYYRINATLNLAIAAGTGAFALNLIVNSSIHSTLWQTQVASYTVSDNVIHGSHDIFLNQNDVVNLSFINSSTGTITLTATNKTNAFQIASLGR